jgi:hypothetical protein
LSACEIARRAGLFRDDYQKVIEDILQRLMRPVSTLGPIIVERDGNQLLISEQWLPTSGFVKVPLRLPQSPLACGLLMFLLAVKDSKKGSAIEDLCHRFGIRKKDRLRTLWSTLDHVNDYLEQLPDEYRRLLREYRIDLPPNYAMQPRHGKAHIYPCSAEDSNERYVDTRNMRFITEDA